MKTNHYESVVIVNAAHEDDQIEATFSRVEELIKSNGGEISDIDKWGRKRLAYPIRKSKSGYYFVYKFTAPRELVAKLERAYRLDESIIRYLTIVLDKKAIENGVKLKEAKVAKELAKVAESEKTAKEQSENNESKE
jgi:small subunit ribosomal protein S6